MNFTWVDIHQFEPKKTGLLYSKLGHDKTYDIYNSYYLGFKRETFYTNKILPEPEIPELPVELKIPEAKGKDSLSELDRLLRAHGIKYKDATEDQKNFYKKYIGKSQSVVIDDAKDTFKNMVKSGKVNPEIVSMLKFIKEAFTCDPSKKGSTPMSSFIESIQKNKIPYDCLPVELLAFIKTLNDTYAEAVGIKPEEFADNFLGMTDEHGRWKFSHRVDLSKLGEDGELVFDIQQMIAKEGFEALMIPGKRMEFLDEVEDMLVVYDEFVKASEEKSKERAKGKAKDYEAAAAKAEAELEETRDFQQIMSQEKVSKDIIRHDRKRYEEVKELGEDQLEQRKQVKRNQEMAKKAASGEFTEEQLEVLDEYHKLQDEVGYLMDLHNGINNDKKRDHGYWRHMAENQAMANYAKDEAKALASLGGKLKRGEITLDQYKDIRAGIESVIDDGKYKNRPIAEVYAELEQQVVEGKARAAVEAEAAEKKKAIEGTMTERERVEAERVEKEKEFIENKDKIKFDKQLTAWAKDIDKAQAYLDELKKTDPDRAKEVEDLILARQLELEVSIEADAKAKAGFKKMVDQEAAIKSGEAAEQVQPETVVENINAEPAPEQPQQNPEAEKEEELESGL